MIALLASVAATVFPVFGLLAIGFGTAKAGWLGEDAAAILNRYVVRLALPALLFRVTAEITWPQLDQPGFVVGYGAGILLTFLAALVVGRLLWGSRREVALSDNVLRGIAASYANNGYMGLPLCIMLFGEAGVLPCALSMILTVMILFPLGILLIEIDMHGGGRKRDLARKVGMALLLNPIIAATLAGSLFALSHLPMPGPLDVLARMLGDTTAPVALVTLGLFLAKSEGGGTPLPIAVLIGLKMLLQPAITAWIVFRLIPTPPLWADAALLLSALPTGTGPVMLAGFYGRDTGLTSRVVLISTLLSILPLAAILAFIRAGG